MSLAKLLQALDSVGQAVHERFPDSPRLPQLDAHLATARMAVEHIHDEAAREAAAPKE